MQGEASWQSHHAVRGRGRQPSRSLGLVFCGDARGRQEDSPDLQLAIRYPATSIQHRPVRHRVRVVVTKTPFVGLECMPSRQCERWTPSSVALTMLSQSVWVARRPGEPEVGHCICCHRVDRGCNAEFGCGTLAFRREVAFAGHIARLAAGRFARAAQWDDSLPISADALVGDSY